MDWHTICLSVATLALAAADDEELKHKMEKKCGYESCPTIHKGAVNIHIVPHTHDDLGWLKTVDQYYTGEKQYIQTACVRAILDSVVSELSKDPERRFIYVETAFFWIWWEKQPESVRGLVKELVDSGRLELVGGAWSMNDEATTHYHDIVDQFTWGLRKLNDTFGPCGRPRVAWQIDPFGHSREFASLLAGMGYDALFLGRVDFQDKERRLAGKAAEMLWRGSDDLGRKADIFTSILYNTYDAPPGFCFDVLCANNDIDDDPHSDGYNVEKKVESFLKFVGQQNSAYTSQNVIITMGGDFTYMEAASWYNNLDKLIRYTNRLSDTLELRVRAFYSTPSCYLAARRSAQVSVPVKEDDFFPYASDAHSYWTGFYTSRPTLKYFVRRGNAYLQMAKQLFVLADQPQDSIEHIDALRSAMGVLQHHDAITGTAKQHVANDYANMLDQAIERSLLVTRTALRKLMRIPLVHSSNLVLELSRCQLNISECHPSEQSSAFIITVYNPLSRSNSWPVRVPVANTEYQVLGPDDREIDSQILPISKSVQWIPLRRSLAKHELLFFPGNVPPLGFRSFHVRRRGWKEQVREKREPYWKKKTERLLTDRQMSNNNSRFLLSVSGNVPPLGFRSFHVRRRGWKEQVREKREPYWKKKTERLLTDRQMSNNNSRFHSKMQLDARTFFPPFLRESDVTQKQNMELYSPFPEKLPKTDATVKQRAGTHSHNAPLNTVETFEENSDFISNEYIRLDIDKSNGQLTSITLRNQQPEPFTQQFYYYTGYVGDNHNAASRSSGAYIFRPKNQTPYLISPSPVYKIYKGPLVEEIHQVFSNYVSQVIRLYKGVEYTEFEWQVGPIPMDDYVGKEVVTRYTCDIQNEGVFYTDSNGRQMMKRIRNYRSTWKLNTKEPVSSNYYPVTSRISIRDANQNLQMSILNDRAQGGSSLSDGEIELLLHRRLLYDDNFGVGESLNEKVAGIGLVATGKHFVSFGKTSESKDRIQASKLHLPPQIFVSKATHLTYDDFLMLNNDWSGLSKPLPLNTHVMTLEPWGNNRILLRLEHIMQKTDDPADLSRTALVYLKSLFTILKLTSVREAKLAANQWVNKTLESSHWLTHESLAIDVNMAFSKSKRHVRSVRKRKKIKKRLSVVRLEPMEIRTFVVKVEYKGDKGEGRRPHPTSSGRELDLDFPIRIGSHSDAPNLTSRDNGHTKLLKRSDAPNLTSPDNRHTKLLKRSAG